MVQKVLKDLVRCGLPASLHPGKIKYCLVTVRIARYFKQDEKGVATMCKIMEDMRNEAAQNAELNKA